MEPGTWIKERRKFLKLTRVELAKRAACSVETIKKIENGARRPSKMVAGSLAEQLKIAESERERFFRFVRGEPGVPMPAPDDIVGTRTYTEPSSSQPNRADRSRILGRIAPLPDQRLFGIEKPLAQLNKAIGAAYRPWIIAIDGLGGIGKTTLAHTLINLALKEQRFDDFGWVSAKQEEYVAGRGIRPVKSHIPAIDGDTLVDVLLAQLSDGPYPLNNREAKRVALHELLQRKVCLIVIDNLETVIDYEALLPLLRHLASPSKFLLTSRMSLQQESDILSQSLSELEREDAIRLLRHESQEQGSHQLQAAPNGDLHRIYDTVGGNPLALKLVIGQAKYLPLDVVLTGIKQAETRDADQLYHYIYRQAWEMLNDEARKLLIALPIVPNGTFKQLVAASKLAPFAVHDALADIRNLSLVEIWADHIEPRYAIHRLTETFLMHEVIKWAEADPNRDKLFFQERVGGMLQHWNQAELISDLDMEQIDREKDGILKAIRLSLSIKSAFVASKALILALTSYMERRGHWQEWQLVLEEGIVVAQQVGDVSGELELMVLRGRILHRQGKGHAVRQNYQRVIRRARQTEQDIEMAKACSNLGFALIDQVQWWRAEVLCCAALKIFEEQQYSHGLAHTHNHLGVLYIRAERHVEATFHLDKACSLWEASGDLYGSISGYFSQAVLHLHTNKPEKMMIWLDRASQNIEQTGDESLLGTLWLNRAEAYIRLNRLVDARRMVVKAEENFKKYANLQKLCVAWEMIGIIKVETDSWEHAEPYFKSAEEGFKKLGAERNLLTLYSQKLTMSLKHDQAEMAEKSYHQIAKIGERQPHLTREIIFQRVMQQYEHQAQ